MSTAAGTPYGCPHLDVECVGLGFDGPVAFVSAHRMNDDSMFSAFAGYSDDEFACEHSEILLQASDGKMKLTVVSADVADSNRELNQLGFTDDEDLEARLENLLDTADVALESDTQTGSVKAFFTCSYGRWSGHEQATVCAV